MYLFVYFSFLIFFFFINIEIDMEDLDMELDWAQVDILTNTSPSLFNNFTYPPQQLNLPTVKTITFLSFIPFFNMLIKHSNVKVIFQ